MADNDARAEFMAAITELREWLAAEERASGGDPRRAAGALMQSLLGWLGAD